MGCLNDNDCDHYLISFWWMHDDCTFVRLKGKNLDEIVAHAKKIAKKSPYGMLCAAKLLKEGRDFRSIGKPVFEHKNWEENLQKWVDAIKNDSIAMKLIEEEKIST